MSTDQTIQEVGTPQECLSKLVMWLTTGRLDDEFKADPVCVSAMVLKVVTAVLEKMHDHTNPNPLIGDAADEFSVGLGELAVAMNVDLPKAGMFLPYIIQLVLPLLLKWLEDALKGYSA